MILDSEMSFIRKKPWLLSLVIALFVSFPNHAWFLCELGIHESDGNELQYLAFFILRMLFFWLLIWLILRYDFKRVKGLHLTTHVMTNLPMALGGFIVYEVLSHIGHCFDKFISILIFQFVFLWIITSFVSFINIMFEYQRKKDSEIEQLKIDNLSSRCKALTSQLNPHFFFNSLNGISSLVRKGNKDNAIEYIDELSNVFRYILQSEKRDIVQLEDEMMFVDAFRHILEVRYSNKLCFAINVPKEKMNLNLPVLSLLPLLENIITHNVIDSEHFMKITLLLTDNDELIVENPIFPKLTAPSTHGTGLRNLENRFGLLMDSNIRIENDGKTFRVILPLNNEN